MSNLWLYRQLVDNYAVDVDAEYDPVLRVRIADKTVSIYTPTPAEYIVNRSVVEKANSMEVNIISYPSSWSDATLEAKEYAKKYGMTIMKHGGLFAYIKRNGILPRS